MTGPTAATGTLFGEDELLPISALQHLLFCERQCALIHIERAWAENSRTVEGRHLHEKAHDAGHETRGGVRIARGLPLRSLRLGLVGVSDIVEFGATSNGPARTATPVEYKRGRPKRHDADKVQLCAQALCLEEMLDIAIPAGALFYGQTRRRLDVVFDHRLRSLTEQAAEHLHALIASGRTPLAVREPKCEQCSLVHLCLPEAIGPRRSASMYVTRAIADSLDDTLSVPAQ